MTGPIVIDGCEVSLIDLSLRTTFRTHWKTLRNHRTLRVQLAAGEVTGEGEAYTLEPDIALSAAEALSLEGRSVWQQEAILEPIPDRAVRSAVDLALHDLLGKAVGVPVHALLGLPPAARETSVSVGIDEPDAMISAARGWIDAGYPILKVKLTTETDLAIIEEIRGIGGPQLRIWVDANQAYEPLQAVEAAQRLARAGVELLEQPLAVGRSSDYAAIAPRIPIPIILDEEVTSAADVARIALAGGVSGVNIKLAKFGGIREARRAIDLARAHRMSIFLGCYFESSLGISGSAHLLACADRIDLDAPLFLDHDPYEGLRFAGATLTSPLGSGLGVARRGA